jgi:hypothetical protein
MTDKKKGFIWGIFAGVILAIVMFAFVAHIANSPDESSATPPDGGGVGGGEVYTPPETFIIPLDVPPPAPVPSIPEPAQAEPAPAVAAPDSQ